MNERIKEIRKAHEPKFNQAKFGERLGVTAAAISKIESGERALTEQMILAICREFKVNEKWLRTGEGEMFEERDDSNIAAIADEYDLDEVSRKILRAYVELPEGYRKGANRFIYALSRAVLEDDIERFRRGVLGLTSREDIGLKVGGIFNEVFPYIGPGNADIDETGIVSILTKPVEEMTDAEIKAKAKQIGELAYQEMQEEKRQAQKALFSKESSAD